MESYYDLNSQNLPLKLEDNISLNNINIASMNEVVYATPENPIIGAYALATCLGIIITDGHGHYALGHILNDYDLLIHKMLKQMENTNALKVSLIPGKNTTKNKLEEIIKHLSNHKKFLYYDFEIEIKDLRNYENQRFHSIEFAYNTKTNEYLKPNYDELILSNRRR